MKKAHRKMTPQQRQAFCKFIESLIRHEYHNIWKNSIKRPVKSPQGYSDWKNTMLSIVLSLSCEDCRFCSFQNETLAYAMLLALHITKRLIRNYFPTYFVSKNLIDSLKASRGEIKNSDINISLEAVTFMLPENTVFNIKGCSIVSVSVSPLSLPSGWSSTTVLKKEADNIDKITKNSDTKCFVFKFQTNDGKTEIRNTKDQAREVREVIDEDEVVFTTYKSLSAKDYASSIDNLVMKLLYVLGEYPHLISTDDETGKGFAGTKNKVQSKSKSPFRSPRWLGKNYTIQTENQSYVGINRKSVSPCTHIRRGHFRRQKCGKQLSEEKVIWIEPTFVNFDE